MCGVVGFSCNNPVEDNYLILHKLIMQSKIRGLHSFGYSYYDTEIITKKYHNINDIKLPKANKIIFHNRYSTSGDYKKHINNQPIHLNKMSLVFNGVLDMRKKEHIEEQYNIKMETENDGEIIIKVCGNNPDKIKDFVSNTQYGSFAGLILTGNNKLLAIRNRFRPLWKLRYNNALYYASTQDIFKRVNKDFEPTELKPNIIYEN